MAKEVVVYFTIEQITLRHQDTSLVNTPGGKEIIRKPEKWIQRWDWSSGKHRERRQAFLPVCIGYIKYSGKESTSGWRADWLYIVIIQYYAFRSKFIHVWRVDLWAMKPNITPSYGVQRLSAKHVAERPITWSTNNENDENRRARIRKCLDSIL